MPPDWSDARQVRRADFPVAYRVTTRWSDVDYYGHVNNAVYYFFFDTAVNGWLMRAAGTDIRTLPALGVVAETSCRYLSELHFPQEVEVGIALEHSGTSSVIYRLGVFGPDSTAGDPPAALGRFVHVYVDATTRRPVPIPAEITVAIAALR